MLFKNLARHLLVRFRNKEARIAFSARVSLDTRLAKGVRVHPGAQIGACTIGRYTYVGARCQIGRTSIGSFTSIGGEVLCGLASHPVHFVSTYPGFYSNRSSGATWFGSFLPFEDSRPVSIGSDVWIGARAVILGGIRIGHGAVIGAGAIVTRDVADYAIVAGIPAKLIRYRFDPDLRARLLQSRWWDAPEATLTKGAPFVNDPEAFLEAVAPKSGQKIPNV
jgi:acetyltransferase-like isoleucine patch superfamily enzyme